MSHFMSQFKKSYIYVLISLFFLISTILLQYISYDYSSIENKVWYNSPLLFACSYFFLKYLLSLNISIKNSCITKLVTFVSKISLFIYFIHILLLEIFIRYFNVLNIKNSLKVIILFNISLTVSILIGYIISRNNFLKKRFLIIK